MVKVGTLSLEVVKVEVQDDAAVKKLWEKVKEASIKGAWRRTAAAAGGCGDWWAAWWPLSGAESCLLLWNAVGPDRPAALSPPPLLRSPAAAFAVELREGQDVEKVRLRPLAGPPPKMGSLGSAPAHRPPHSAKPRWRPARTPAPTATSVCMATCLSCERPSATDVRLRPRPLLTRAPPPLSDIGTDYPGELRLNLCRSKNSSAASGTKVLANAGARAPTFLAFPLPARLTPPSLSQASS